MKRRRIRALAVLLVFSFGMLGLLSLVAFMAAGNAGEHTLPGTPAPVAAVHSGGSQPAGEMADTTETASTSAAAKEEQAAAADIAPLLTTPTADTVPATETVLAGGQKALVRMDADTGTPAFLTGDIATAAGSPVEKTFAFLEENKGLYRLSEPGAEMELAEVTTDRLGMSHVRLDQLHEGVPVFGADIVVHLSADGDIAAANGKYIPGIAVDISPRLDEAEAAAAAIGALAYGDGAEAESVELTILAPADREARLSWKVVLTATEPPLRQVVFIAADDGEVLGGYDDLQDIKSRKTYTANNGTTLPGTLLISEGGTSSDAVAQAAHDNIGLTYDFYFNTFGRDSYNGAGALLKSSVHYGSSYNNAFWNGSQMTYGDGDGYVFSPLGNAVDVVAHELTHGVIQNSAGLTYSYQSGALNESYADVFGVMVDRDDWLLGEEVYTPLTPGDALRSLSNPAQYGQPAHMDSYRDTTSDNGGVHTNSGIPNKAAYNVAVAIGKDKMEQIWYRALTLYLTSGSQFTDARDASVEAAADLYGAGSSEVTAVVNGFNAVGVGGSQVSDMTARIEIEHTYRGDLVVTLGVGDPAAPSWSTVVSKRSGGSADNIYQTVDITPASAYLPPDWQNRWFLQVYDAAGYDTGQIVKFSITDHGDTYTATDVPVDITDFQTVVSYLPTEDTTPPAVTAMSPQPGATGVYVSAGVSAQFSESVDAATLNGESFELFGPGGTSVPSAVSYEAGTRTAKLVPDAPLEYMTAYQARLTTGITDMAGIPLDQVYEWSFTTAPEPKLYYFTWYDMNSRSMSDWVVMGNPDAHTYNAGFDVRLNSLGAGGDPIVVPPGATEAATYPGQMGGPVTVAALEGESQIVSKRTLYGGSLEEIVGIAADQLDSHYYFTWYDAASAGARDWVLVSNPGDEAVDVEVYIGGRLMDGSPWRVEPGATVTPEFKSVIGGPVEVLAYLAGEPSQPREVIVSQRVTWKGDFTEMMGIPASGLSSEYLFTWYDMKSRGAKSWILAGNPHADRDLVVEIRIAGQLMTDPVSGNPWFMIPAGASVTPTFPGVMSGPVTVKGFDAATYAPGDPASPQLSFYATERSLFGDTFEEVAGYGTDRLAAAYFYSWYDQQSAGSRDWVLIANPGVEAVVAEVWIAGTRVSTLTVEPGTTQTPAYPGMMNGPVEVRGFLASTYDPDSPGTPNALLFSSQRTMWNGNFNEVPGTVLD